MSELLRSEGCIIFAVFFQLLAMIFALTAIFSPSWIQVNVYNSPLKVTVGVWNFCRYEENKTTSCQYLHGTKLSEILWLDMDFIIWPQILSIVVFMLGFTSIYLVYQNRKKIVVSITEIYYFAVSLSVISESCLLVILLIYNANYVNQKGYIEKYSSVNNLKWGIIVAWVGLLCHTIANFCLTSVHYIQKSIRYRKKSRYAAVVKFSTDFFASNIKKNTNTDGISLDITPRNDYFTKMLSKTIDSSNKNDYERIEDTGL